MKPAPADVNRALLYLAILLALILAGLFGYRLQISTGGLTFEPTSIAAGQLRS